MAALRINILTNYAGQLWMAATGLAFLPLYIRILGMEAFGLIGIMLSFQSFIQLFDFGIGNAVNRELSRRAHDPAQCAGARDLVRTSEILIWLMALAAALLIWLCSRPLADHWLHLRVLARSDTSNAMAMIGFAIAFFWPSTFYANCLSGLEEQPKLNIVNSLFATLRYAGVVPVLLWVSPTIKAFLSWYAIVGISQSLTMAIIVWRELPQGNRPARWFLKELHGSYRFAGGLFITGILAIGVSQFDRLALATLRPLEELGYYTLAVSIASGMGRVIQPMFNALYPRFTRLIAHDNEKALRELYHFSSQCLAVIIASVAMVLIIFAHDVALLWTGNADLATKISLPLAMLVAGSALNGLMNIPYALQLANGWTRLAVSMNAASLTIGIPYCLWAVSHYGATGAASMWLLVNAFLVLTGIPLMHKRLLCGEMARWYVHDVLPPVIAAGIAVSVGHWLLPTLRRNLDGFMLLILMSGMALLSAASASPLVRQLVLKRVWQWCTNRH